MPTLLARAGSPCRLSVTQLRTLAAMEVEVYVRRHGPPVARAADLPAGSWSGAQVEDALAKALARAAGVADVDSFCRCWQALGLALPDLMQLRGNPQRKRELWRQMRGRQRLP